MLSRFQTSVTLTLFCWCLLFLAAGCSDRDPMGLEQAHGNRDPLVFTDNYHDDYFQAFFQTHITAVSVDSVYAYNGLAQDGARSLKVNVPPAGSSLGLYSGGVLTSGGARDLTDFNALTFYARASRNITMDVLGFGNDNTGTSLYEAGRNAVPLGTEWARVVIPIPNSAKLLNERGLFTFAEKQEPQFPDGYDIWFDEMCYVHLDNITDPRPFMPSSNRQYFVGSLVNVSGTRTTFDIEGTDVVVDHMPGYFDYSVSDPQVAKVVTNGIRIVGEGIATVTATLGDVPVSGQVTMNAYQAPPAPAPAPPYPAGDVISLFSDVYQNIHVDSWNPNWTYSTAEEGTFTIAGDNMRSYAALNFVGIEFLGNKVDATGMDYFHLDVYAPFGSDFSVKFVTFSEGNGFLGQAEVTFTADTDPAFVPGQWSSLDIPLSAFTFQPAQDNPWAGIGQLVLSTSDAQLVLLDNMYWYR